MMSGKGGKQGGRGTEEEKDGSTTRNMEGREKYQFVVFAKAMDICRLERGSSCCLSRAIPLKVSLCDDNPLDGGVRVIRG